MDSQQTKNKALQTQFRHFKLNSVFKVLGVFEAFGLKSKSYTPIAEQGASSHCNVELAFGLKKGE